MLTSSKFNGKESRNFLAHKNSELYGYLQLFVIGLLFYLWATQSFPLSLKPCF